MHELRPNDTVLRNRPPFSQGSVLAQLLGLQKHVQKRGLEVKIVLRPLEKTTTFFGRSRVRGFYLRPVTNGSVCASVRLPGCGPLQKSKLGRGLVNKSPNWAEG